MRRARVRTMHGDETAAANIAAAVRPDNTDEMSTVVDGAAVVTTVERETTGGLRATVDDYVVNLRVADRLIDGDEDGSAASERGTSEADASEAGADDRNASEADADERSANAADSTTTENA